MADRSKSSNAGAEVGVGVVVGAQTGVYVYAEASVGSSKANSDSSTWQNTTLTGQNISLKAEGDTTLRGATATADRIDVKTGGTLTIESLQDIAESMSKNSQVGGRVQVAFGNAWNADGYASAGKAEGSYQGVGQQSGLFAGNGGYHVDAGHVNLIGGAIASTNAGNSELTADSLTFTDLQNQMDYSASSGSISGGAGGQMKGWDPGVAVPRGGPGMPMSESGSDSSSTLATLTEGNITIGGKQTTAAELGINTDASAAHKALDSLPDLQQMLQQQRAMTEATGTVVNAGMQIRSEINASIDAATERREAVKAILNDPEQRAALTPEREGQLIAMGAAASSEINRLQKAGVLVGAITGGLAASSGSAGSIVGGTLAPAISYQIGQYFKENADRNMVDGGNRGEEGSATHLLAHALLGAAVASAGGDNALIGALAAGGAEAAAPSIARFMFGKNSKELTASEKAAVSAVAGIGGAMLGTFQDGMLGAAAGSNAAKNAVENNWGEVGHYSTMATLLYLGGFNESDAKAIAIAAWVPDTDRRNAITPFNVAWAKLKGTPQQHNHGLGGETDPEVVKATQEYWGKKVAVILADIKKNEDNPAAKRAILDNLENQRALHLFGDSFAHVQPDGTQFKPVMGHFTASTYDSGAKDPDNPYTHPDAYLAYSLAIYKVATGASNGRQLRDSDYIADLASRVSAAKEETVQKGVLDSAASFFMPTRTSGLVDSPMADCGLYCMYVPAGWMARPELERIYRTPAEFPKTPVIDWTKFSQGRW